jgi:O-antigen/teichoic acid export membrane protein
LDQYKRNVLFSWLAILLNLGVVFILTPYLIDSMGKYIYGLWLVINSVIGYLNVVELGINISTGRFVNLHWSRGEKKQASQVISSTSAFYFALLLLAPLTIYIVSPDIVLSFIEEKAIAADVATGVFLVSIALFLNISAANIRVRLNANSRFDIISFIEIGNIAIRTVLIIFFIIASAHLTIIDLALATLGGAVASFLASIFLSSRYGVELHINPSYIKLSTLRRLLNFSVWVLVSNLGVMSINYSDNIIISFFIGADYVAIYAIGYMLTTHLITILSKISQVKIPTITQIIGREEKDKLIKELNKLYSFVCIISIPAIACFILLAENFIVLWVGVDFKQSALISLILVVGQVPYLSMQGLGAALWAKNIVKQLSLVKLFIAALNIVLSIALIYVLEDKLIAVAIGTMTASLLETLIILPWMVRKYLGIQLLQVIRINLVFPLQCITLITFYKVIFSESINGWLSFILIGAGCFLVFSTVSFIAYKVMPKVLQIKMAN